MNFKKILLVLLYFVFLFMFIIYLKHDSKVMSGEWNERSFEEIYGNPHKIFENVGTIMNFQSNLSNQNVSL